MTVDFSLLPDGGISWLDASGPESHVVLSTRVRLARNLAGRTYPGRATDDDRRTVLSEIETAARNTGALANSVEFRIEGLDLNDRQLLHERHLVSKELVGLEPGRNARPGAALIFGDHVGAMVNEEDHVRLQVFLSGFSLAEAYSRLDSLDSQLGKLLSFAFHPEFGYLTSCPTNAGTGLRASVLIHLPGLVLTKEISKVLQGLSQVGLTFRGLYGEGSEVVGNFFQLSNQTTLGKSEDDLLDHLGKVVKQVIEYEERSREVLKTEAPNVIADKVWRAYGLLRYARSLTFDETMNLLSGVRLGVGLNLISGLSVYSLNKLLVYTQTAHLVESVGRNIAESDLSKVRADYVRAVLEGEEQEDGN